MPEQRGGCGPGDQAGRMGATEAPDINSRAVVISACLDGPGT